MRCVHQACTGWIVPRTGVAPKETGAWCAWRRGSRPVLSAPTPPTGAPGFALGRARVRRAARAGRAGQRKEHSSRVPTGPGGRRQRRPRPPPCSPRAMLAGDGPVLAQVEPRWGGSGQARLGAPSPCPSVRRRVPGGTGPGAPVHGLGHAQPPASASLRTAVAALAQRRRPARQSHGRGCGGVVAWGLSPQDCGAVAAPLPPDLEPSPAQLTRPAVW